MTFLGDDMLMLMSERPDVRELRNYIANNFNMASKEYISD